MWVVPYRSVCALLGSATTEPQHLRVCEGAAGRVVVLGWTPCVGLLLRSL